MAKNIEKARGGSIIGSVGAVLIGAAVLLFACSLIFNNLKAAGQPNAYLTGNTNANNASNNVTNADWASFNGTVAQISTILVASVILMAVLGIVLVGAAIIGTIGGAFGG